MKEQSELEERKTPKSKAHPDTFLAQPRRPTGQRKRPKTSLDVPLIGQNQQKSGPVYSAMCVEELKPKTVIFDIFSASAMTSQKNKGESAMGMSDSSITE